jgi:hypothetical protein
LDKLPGPGRSQAKAAITHHSPSEIIGELVRKELSASA